MSDTAYVDINNLKRKLIKQSIKINNKRYITRETLKKLLSLDYEKVKFLTKTKKWNKIAEKITTQGNRYTLYFPIDKIDDSMLTKLISYAVNQQSNQSKNKKLTPKEPFKSDIKEIKPREVKNKNIKTRTREERKSMSQGTQVMTPLDNTGTEVKKATLEKNSKEPSILVISKEDKAKLEERLKDLTEVVNELIYYVAEVLYELQVIEENERLKRSGKYEKFCIKWKEWNEKLSPLFRGKIGN